MGIVQIFAEGIVNVSSLDYFDFIGEVVRGII
jgi:hypothetical protein